MIDQFGRKIEYLRISVTDRCNLRCRYCMPSSGIEHHSHAEILTFNEILTFVKIFVKLGITKVKITGGEPLVRRDVCKLIQSLKKLDGIEEVTMTTNGVLLEQFLPDLLYAGLDGINISLDTLDREKYKVITGFDELDAVLSSIKTCQAVENLNVKINAVTLKDYNFGEIEELALLAKNTPLDVRFIEMMPVGLGAGFKGYSQNDILTRLEASYGKAVQIEQQHGNGPAVYYDFPNFNGKIGFISAMSHQFCQSCNRIRLTSEGFLKPCLQYAEGIDLKKHLRQGSSEEQLTVLIRDTIYNKPGKHCFLSPDERADKKQMWGIGG